MRVVAKQAPTVLVYAGDADHWAPSSHIDDLRELGRKGFIPRIDDGDNDGGGGGGSQISVRHHPHLKHDFVTDPSQLDFVADLCVAELLESEKRRREEDPRCGSGSGNGSGSGSASFRSRL